MGWPWCDESRVARSRGVDPRTSDRFVVPHAATGVGAARRSSFANVHIASAVNAYKLRAFTLLRSCVLPSISARRGAVNEGVKEFICAMQRYVVRGKRARFSVERVQSEEKEVTTLQDRMNSLLR